MAAKGDASGIGYRHWLGVAWAGGDGKDIKPAKPVRALVGDEDRFDAAGTLRLHTFGYAMDNMKARAWSEGLMPMHHVPAANHEQFSVHAQALIEGAKLAEMYLRMAVKGLIARRPKDIKRDLVQTATRFWHATEKPFYQRLASSVLEANDLETLEDLRRSWHGDLKRHVKTLFEIEVGPTDFRAINPRQVATAWNDLQKNLHGPKIYRVLDVPKKAKTESKGGIS